MASRNIGSLMQNGTGLAGSKQCKPAHAQSDISPWLQKAISNRSPHLHFDDLWRGGCCEFYRQHRAYDRRGLDDGRDAGSLQIRTERHLVWPAAQDRRPVRHVYAGRADWVPRGQDQAVLNHRIEPVRGSDEFEDERLTG